MMLYHATTLKNAIGIMAEGFRDGTGSYGFAGIALRGVWLADSPLGVNEGAAGDAVLRVDLPLSQGELAAYHVVSEVPSGYHEFLIPASVVNDASVEIVIIDVGDPGPGL